MNLDEWAGHKPTLEWAERLESDEDYEDFYTVEGIKAANKVLDRYISHLKALPSNPSEDEVLACVKQVVLNLNEVNEEHNDFIETDEREELYEFIDGAARSVGLNSEEDITEEWREESGNVIIV
ncbi:hypothetical protein [Alkalihalophilus marmarensis]|uniref:hypothetical protein n=1 Tax=Alkalihalophilus marmarensis TaxID=521377 RepID=UPI002E2261CA|nr:hypothetical protein [Alkalihalophilus marmarensis]